MNILVTGAGGFVGSAAIERLLADGWRVRAAMRAVPNPVGQRADVDWRPVGEIAPETDWTSHLVGCDAVLHLAARVHVMQDEAVDPQQAYWRSNTGATRSLALAAAQAGVRRFVFISSVKVNGEGRSMPYDETDEAEPMDFYGLSKAEAEKDLREISLRTGMEVVILRPPLVYGPWVRANFLQLLKMVDSGVPLPFGSIANRRSLVFLGNLVDAVSLCLKAPAAAGKTYLISDGQDVSTPELVRGMAQALGCPARLMPCPMALLGMLGRVLGRKDVIDRLAGDLFVDSTRIRRELGWTPPYTLAQGMAATAAWYKSQKECV